MKTIKEFLMSLASNGRDLIATLLFLICILGVTEVISNLGQTYGIDLSDTKDFVFAAGKFAAVALCGVGYLTHVTFRQSLGKHDLYEFMNTWETELTPKERLEWFFKLSITGIIAAALIFGIGV